jgi:HSP20 family molecular chaperone IbpA
MSLFPRAFDSPSPSFTPLFQLLEDFDSYSRQFDSGHSHGIRRKFNPNFDLQELPDSYHLHGELPGIERGDVEMEFTGPQTLTIHGHSERSYTSSTPAAGFIERSPTGGAITEGSEDSTAQEVARHEEATETEADTAVTHAEKAQQPLEKYWVSERSYGEFARSFNFPEPVEQDRVQASMQNGILSVILPKAPTHGGRKISIS